MDGNTPSAKSIRNRTYKSLRFVIFRDNHALNLILKKRNLIDSSDNKNRFIYLKKTLKHQIIKIYLNVKTRSIVLFVSLILFKFKSF